MFQQQILIELIVYPKMNSLLSFTHLDVPDLNVKEKFMGERVS